MGLQGAKRNGVAVLRGAGGRASQALNARQARSAFRDGAHAWADDDQPAAQAAFQRALQRDPANADALLGLQFYTPDDVDLCARLYAARGRVGVYQRRPRVGVHGRCFPMQFHAVNVLGVSDTALAYATALAAAQRPADAHRLLHEHCDELDGRLVGALRARMAYDRGDFPAAATLTAPLLGDRRLGDDPALLHAAALLFDGKPEQGRDLLINCRLTSPSAPARAWATYLLALAHQHAGRHDHAHALLEDLHISQPGYLDVARRLHGMTLAAPLAAEDPFEAIADMFARGELADDPAIPDNQ